MTIYHLTPADRRRRSRMTGAGRAFENSACSKRLKRRSRPVGLCAALLLLAGMIHCERLQKPPSPSNVPAKAVFDRRTGMWSHTSPEGMASQYYASGILATRGKLVNGRREGLWNTYSMSGKQVTAIGRYKDGKRDGVWNYYDTEGKLYLKLAYQPLPIRIELYLMHFDYGNENGPYERFFPDGRLEERGIYRGGFLEGPLVRYYRNGKKFIEGRYVKDLMEGRWSYYYPEGNLEREEHYKNGVLHGVLKNFRPDGSLHQLINFDAGKIIERKVFP